MSAVYRRTPVGFDRPETVGCGVVHAVGVGCGGTLEIPAVSFDSVAVFVGKISYGPVASVDAGVVGINSVSGVIKHFVELIRRIGFFARAFVIRSVRPCEIGNDRIFDARYQTGVVIRSYAYVEFEDVLFAGGYYVAVLL